MKTTFMIAMTDGPREVFGFVDGFFGIDERTPGVWCVTHIRTGNNLSRMAAPTLDAAREAVAILNDHPDIWNNGRFGREYSAVSRLKWLREMRKFAQSPEGRRVKTLLPLQIAEGE